MGTAVHAAVAETHISVVFFMGDRVFKIKKPVTFDFLDLSDRSVRARLCDREVELNRRLAPDVYLGVATLRLPGGDIDEPVVVMRRMPDDRRLAALVTADDGRVPALLEELAALLARFHAAAERSPTIAGSGSAEAVATRWETNFAEMRHHAATVLDPTLLERAEALSRAFLAGRAALFGQRCADGKICDGHGDLQADDVFCLDDGPRVLDCIEFDDALRYADVVDDVAFLVMDLERLGAPHHAAAFAHAYEQASGEVFPSALLHVAIAYRAQVRAKVACLRAAQVADSHEVSAATDAASVLLELCIRHLETCRVRCVMVGGLPGTGKSTLAAALAARHGFEVIRSDVVRKESGGSASADGERAADLYAAETADAVYRTMLLRAEGLLGTGRSVILDATFASERHRELAREMTASTASELTELRCVLDPAEAGRRIDARRAEGSDPSDATVEVAAAMAATTDPWPTSIAVATRDSVEATCDRAELVIFPGQAPKP